MVNVVVKSTLVEIFNRFTCLKKAVLLLVRFKGFLFFADLRRIKALNWLKSIFLFESAKKKNRFFETCKPTGRAVQCTARLADTVVQCTII